jgi:hypothetical protein
VSKVYLSSFGDRNNNNLESYTRDDVLITGVMDNNENENNNDDDQEHPYEIQIDEDDNEDVIVLQDPISIQDHSEEQENEPNDNVDNDPRRVPDGRGSGENISIEVRMLHV